MRWTETQADEVHFRELHQQVWDKCFNSRVSLTVELRSGQRVRGRFGGSHMAKDKDKNGIWRYSESITVLGNDSSRQEVDLLEIVKLMAEGD